MLISHLPAGYINTFLSKFIWFRKLNKKQVITLFILGSLLGLLPDIDIVYYYLFNAELSHRELFTHSPFPYVIGSIILFSIGLLMRNNFIKSFSFLFFLSPLVHLILDTTTAGVSLLYPFSNKLYGLLMFPALNDGIYGQYIYVFLYSLELFLILSAINILIFQFIKNKLINYSSLALSIIMLLIVIISLTWLNNDLYPKNSLQYYGDIDNDGIINMRDQDIDGDSIININDQDADNDKLTNRDDLINEINRMNGLRYDFSEDEYFNILSRFGLLSSADLISKSHDAAGIFLGAEMKVDHAKDESKYNSNPEDEDFNQNFNNIYIFYKNNNFLIQNTNNLAVGDIIFWGSENNIEHISIISDINNGNISILFGNKNSGKIGSIKLSNYHDFNYILEYGKIFK